MKTSGRHFIGIDLGTSSCSVAYVVDDPRQRDARTVPVQVVTVPVDAGGFRVEVNRIPSIVAAPLDPKAKAGALFGFEFASAFRSRKKDATLLRRGRDFFTSVKSDLGTLRAYTRSRVPGCRTPAEVTAVILDRLRALAHQANAALDLRKAPVVITVPASFSALARTETLDAAAAAGFERERVRLLDEPVAALLDLLNSPDAAVLLDDEPKNLLVFDYGAGTCDVALLRVRFDPETATGLHVENLAISNYHRLGGDDVDAGIMAEVVWPQICSVGAADGPAQLPPPRDRGHLHRHRGPPPEGADVRRRGDRRAHLLVGEGGRGAGAGPRPLGAAGRDLPELRKGLPRHFEMDSDQFREVMAPFLSLPREADDAERSLLFPVEQTLARGGVKPDALAAVVLHGGSSLNPYVRRLMNDVFGRHDLFRDTHVVVATPDPLVSVAHGAAVACYWREAREVEIVRPIMPEDFGVVLRDDRHVRPRRRRHAAALPRRRRRRGRQRRRRALRGARGRHADAAGPVLHRHRAAAAAGGDDQGPGARRARPRARPVRITASRGGGQDAAVVVPHRRRRGAARARGGRSLDQPCPRPRRAGPARGAAVHPRRHRAGAPGDAEDAGRGGERAAALRRPRRRAARHRGRASRRTGPSPRWARRTTRTASS